MFDSLDGRFEKSINEFANAVKSNANYIVSCDPSNLLQAHRLFHDDTKENALDVCLKRGNIYLNHLKCFLLPSSRYIVEAYNCVMRQWLQNKTDHNFSCIEYVYKAAKDRDKLNIICKLLSQSTPKTQRILLFRNDINKGYVLCGLKALAKQSCIIEGQHYADVDFNLLKRLTPRIRLNVFMKLIKFNFPIEWDGVCCARAPFKRIPTKKEVANLMFPCLILDFDKTQKVITYYKDKFLTKNKW